VLTMAATCKHQTPPMEEERGGEMFPIRNASIRI
jgi:hypothetical protein